MLRNGIRPLSRRHVCGGFSTLTCWNGKPQQPQQQQQRRLKSTARTTSKRLRTRIPVVYSSVLTRSSVSCSAAAPQVEATAVGIEFVDGIPTAAATAEVEAKSSYRAFFELLVKGQQNVWSLPTSLQQAEKTEEAVDRSWLVYFDQLGTLDRTAPSPIELLENESDEEQFDSTVKLTTNALAAEDELIPSTPLGVDNTASVNDHPKESPETYSLFNAETAVAQDYHAEQQQLEQQQPQSQVDLLVNDDVRVAKNAAYFARCQADLARAVKNKKVRRALELLNEFRAQAPEADLYPFQPDIIRSLFLLAERNRLPLECYRVFQYYKQLTFDEDSGGGDLNAYVSMYERLGNSIRYLNDENSRKRLPSGRMLPMPEVDEMVFSVLEDIRKLDREGKQACYPVTISSLMQQRSVFYCRFARPLYDELLELNLQVNPQYWEHLLGFSKFTRQDYLPFPDILKRVVEHGTQRPHPQCISNAIENMFPYKDEKEMQTVLEAIHYLQSNKRTKNKEVNYDEQLQTSGGLNGTATHEFYDYTIDISILELMATAGSRSGNREISLLIWDLLKLFGHHPTEAICESTVVAFATDPDTYMNAFALLEEMEKSYGFEPSRALIRSMSVHMRQSKGFIEQALDVIQQMNRSGESMSVHALNTVLSACAERGDVPLALNLLYDAFSGYKLQPNADSFSFAFEALGKHISKRIRFLTPGDVENLLDAADNLVTAMEDRKIAPTHHVIRDYVEFLCGVGEVETATNLVLQARETSGLVGSKTIYKAAITNANINKFEAARMICSCSNEPMLFLVNMIDKREAEALQKQDSTDDTTDSLESSGRKERDS